MEYRAFEERSARGGGVRWRRVALRVGRGRRWGGEDISKIEY